MKCFVGDVDNPQRQIVYNALQTPDGTILESFSRHDYKEHVDKNGKLYSVDGGLAYQHYDMHGDEKLLTVYLDEPFTKVRQYFHWGAVRDKKRVWIKLCDIDDDHLDKLTLYEPAATWARLLFINEKYYRQMLTQVF